MATPLMILAGPVIDAGESLSGALDVSSGSVVRLTMPADWFDAVLTFQISSDGQSYNDFYRVDGTEVEIPVTPGAGIIFPRDFMIGVAYIKFRSGTAGNPVAQPERREFSVGVLPTAGPGPTEEPERETKPAVDRRSGAKRYRRPARVKRKHR